MTLMVLSLNACVPHKEVTYFNDLDGKSEGSLAIPDPPDPILAKDDLVEIGITSTSEAANEYFVKAGSQTDEDYRGNVYRISSSGTIDLPLVGEMKLAGHTLEEAESILKSSLVEYLRDPTVNIRLVNFRITILGEVNKPGLYRVPSSQATVTEALGLAGDLTLYGRRNNVLVIRQTGEEKSFFRINLNESSILTRPEYFLRTGDVIYVEPTKGRTSADDNVYRILPLLLSGLTFVAVVIGLSR